MRAALAAAALLPAHPALAQASASVALTSEYSVRGVSLSDGRPAPQLSLGYDSPQGWYAGAFASRVVLAERANNTELIAYGGYAHRLPSGLSWEAGATSTVFLHESEYNYREAYAGLASDHLSGRLYLAPAYYGYGGRVAYAELNGFYPLREHIKLIAHLGVLHALQQGTAGTRDRIDVRLALGADIGRYNVQLAWQTSAAGAGHGGGQAARALALSASCSF